MLSRPAWKYSATFRCRSHEFSKPLKKLNYRIKAKKYTDNSQTLGSCKSFTHQPYLNFQSTDHKSVLYSCAVKLHVQLNSHAG